MARATVNIPFVKSGYVRQANPNTVYLTDPNTEYDLIAEASGTSVNRRAMLFGREEVPSSLKYLRLYSVSFTFCLYADDTYGPSSLPDRFLVRSCGDFDPNTLTYNTRPEIDSSFGTEYMQCASAADKKIWKNYVSSHTAWTDPELSKRTAKYLNNKGVALYYADTSYYNTWKIKTVLLDGSSQPYLTLEYDNSETVKSKISIKNKIADSINPAAAQTVSWDLIRDEAQDYYCYAEEWDQTSAKLYWRENGASSWNVINVSGNVKQLTIPANTFGTGKSYEYYVQATDVLGTSSQTEIFTFSTPATQITQTNCPTSGYVNPRNAISFGWYYNSSAGTVTAGNTVLHWRVSGTENWTDVQATARANSLTIQANTFPTASTIQWYLSGTDSTGYASQTSVYSFSTAAGAVNAQAISPYNTVESNNQTITFQWSYSSADGFEPSRYKFMWKLVTDADWTTLLDETDVVTEYTFPEYTFPAGEIRWGVVPYNIDGVSGTGTSKTFICYGAPEAPVVYVEEKPYTTVTWQASDQQAYKIRVDGTVYGPYFGTEKSFELPDYLEDGEHTVGVSVVGTYGLWSEWGVSIITVQNDPGQDIILAAEEGVDVTLQITAAGEGQTFLIYRDDVLIGKTGQNTFTDRFALGEHTYRVISKLPDGNYSTSNEATAEAVVGDLSIAALAGGEWLRIPYSLRDQIDPAYQATVISTYHHVSGSEYPDAVISPYRDLSVSGSALFLSGQRSEQKRFEELFGQAVIIKFRDGTVFVGVLDSWNREPNRWHYTAYTFTVRQIEFEDYVDDTE